MNSLNSLGRKNWWFFSLLLVGSLIWGWFTSPPEKVHTPLEPKELPPLTETGQPSLGFVNQKIVFMGSEFSFLVESDDDERVLHILPKVVSRLQQLDSQLTAWRPGGDIARLNEQAGIAPTVVHPETFKLLARAKQIYQDTKGAFDVTVSSIEDLWPFREPGHPLPSPEDLKTQLKLVNAALIEMNETAHTVYLPQAGMKIELRELGKSYAASVALQTLKELGIQRAAIRVGRAIYLLGKKDTGPWIVTLEDPRSPGTVMERFLVGEVAVATARNDERYFVKEGKWYGHLIDPKTGWPVTNDCQSVTVITHDQRLAGPYAAAIFVMGIQKGLAWVEENEGVEAFIVDTQGQVYRSSGWQQLTQPITPARTSVSVANSQPNSPPTSKSRRTPPKNLLGPSAGRTLDLQAGEMLKIPEENHHPAFLLDRTEVTNQQYERFLLDVTLQHPHEFCHPEEPKNKDHTPRYWREYRSPLFKATVAAQLAPFNQETFKQPDHPVVGIDWWDAYSFARWAGKRLPTQAEWHRAACGTDGRQWPWGNQWDYQKANIGGEKWGEQDGFIYSAPAISFLNGASPYQVLNLAGNVSEWTQEGYVMGGSSKSSPTGVSCQAQEILWEPEFRAFDIGFRGAADILQ